MATDYLRYPVLFVDDEPQNQVVFRYAMEGQFEILTASSGEEALRVMATEDVAVLLTDQRMPQMTGVALCAQASRLFPKVVRIIVTAYADVHAAIDAINEGHVSRYVLKPWQNEELAETLRTSIDFVHLQRTVEDVELRLLRSGGSEVAEVMRSQFLHEFANPLGALSLTLEHSMRQAERTRELLGHDGAGTHDARSLLDDSINSQQEALAVVGELKELSRRLRAGRRLTSPTAGASCDVGRVVDATVRIIRPELERSARVDVVLEAAPMAAIDASTLGRLVLNLLLNASEAIESVERAEHRIAVAVMAGPAGTIIRVDDTGPGVPLRDRDRIFQAYVTTKQEGSGLGLSVVQEALAEIRGEVAVEDSPIGGARFELRLPPK